MKKFYLHSNTSLLLFLLTSIISCSSQPNPNALENVYVEPIVQNNINKLDKGELIANLDEKTWVIYQDQKDNYWFGSNGNGVIYYDGKNLIKYTEKDGLIDNTIRDIQEDNLGNVFIGTPEGISKYDGNTFTTLKPIIPSSNEWKLVPNDLWFNCVFNNIYRYDGENTYELKLPRQDLKKAFGVEVKGVPFKAMNNSPYAVYGIDKDREGNIWIGTIAAGVFRYDGHSFLWIAEKELSTLPDGRLPGVRSMIEDKDGYIWLSNFISKYRISDRDSNTQYEKLQGIDMSDVQFENRISYFNSGLSANNGDLWMTTYTRGVWKYDGDQLLNVPINDGTGVLLISIYQDNKGVLWLGTDNAGVYKFNGEFFEKFEPLKNGRNH